MNKKISVTILTFALFLAAKIQSAENLSRADQLFSACQAGVYQIRVIDKSSGKKSCIGSGFSVNADGLFATNYHVVSDFVMEPKRFRLEYAAHNGATGPLRLLDIDVGP
jgi:serine protease Do